MKLATAVRKHLLARRYTQIRSDKDLKTFTLRESVAEQQGLLDHYTMEWIGEARGNMERHMMTLQNDRCTQPLHYIFPDNRFTIELRSHRKHVEHHRQREKRFPVQMIRDQNPRHEDTYDTHLLPGQRAGRNFYPSSSFTDNIGEELTDPESLTYEIRTYEATALEYLERPTTERDTNVFTEMLKCGTNLEGNIKHEHLHEQVKWIPFDSEENELILPIAEQVDHIKVEIKSMSHKLIKTVSTVLANRMERETRSALTTMWEIKTGKRQNSQTYRDYFENRYVKITPAQINSSDALYLEFLKAGVNLEGNISAEEREWYEITGWKEALMEYKELISTLNPKESQEKIQFEITDLNQKITNFRRGSLYLEFLKAGVNLEANIEEYDKSKWLSALQEYREYLVKVNLKSPAELVADEIEDLNKKMEEHWANVTKAENLNNDLEWWRDNLQGNEIMSNIEDDQTEGHGLDDVFVQVEKWLEESETGDSTIDLDQGTISVIQNRVKMIRQYMELKMIDRLNWACE